MLFETRFPLALFATYAMVASSAYAGEFTKSEVRIVVFAESKTDGLLLLEELRNAGYTNPNNVVDTQPNANHNVKYGGASESLITDVLQRSQDLFGVEFQRIKKFDDSVADVFINIPPNSLPTRRPLDQPTYASCQYEPGQTIDWTGFEVGKLVRLNRHPTVDGYANWTADMDTFVGRFARITEHHNEVDPSGCAMVSVDADNGQWLWRVAALSPYTPPDTLNRSSSVLTIFVDDTATGELALQSLKDAGYDNEANRILLNPNADYNIKTGTRNRALVMDLLALMQPIVKADFNLIAEALDDPNEIYINLPTPPFINPETYPLTVITEDFSSAKLLLKTLEAQGFSHPENRIIEGISERFSMEYGSAPSNLLDRISVTAEPIFNTSFYREQLPSDLDQDIIIRLPVFSQAYIDPQYNKHGVPQACGYTDPRLVTGSITPGTMVRLSYHRPVDEERNWNDKMDAFRGRVAQVTEVVGNDAQGCPVVHVDIDNQRWTWRVRDLKRVK